jgi:hypothetical protein
MKNYFNLLTKLAFYKTATSIRFKMWFYFVGIPFKSTYYGLGNNKVDIDVYKVGNGISVTVTKNECAIMTERTEIKEGITDVEFRGLTLGIKDMSVFDVPKACQNGTSTSPFSRVSLQLFRSEIATCSKMYQFVFTQMLNLKMIFNVLSGILQKGQTNNISIGYYMAWFCDWFVYFIMVFNAIFNNISVISWRSVRLVQETGRPGERKPLTCLKSLSNLMLHT